MRKIILASSSPRRKELLQSLGLRFRVAPSNVREVFNPRLHPARQAEELSKQKAEAVVKKFADSLIIAADTLVAVDNEILGKPKDLQDAKRILNKLNGKKQLVITGFTIVDTATGKIVTKSVITKLSMRKISVKEIEAYIKKENVFDKAGGYAIQGVGSIFFEKIEGDYNNVIGLPLFALSRELKKFGVEVL